MDIEKHLLNLYSDELKWDFTNFKGFIENFNNFIKPYYLENKYFYRCIKYDEDEKYYKMNCESKTLIVNLLNKIIYDTPLNFYKKIEK